MAAARGAPLPPPFDDPLIMAGQGTAGLEIADQCAARGLVPEAVLVPVSGGGLIGGMAVTARALKPRLRVYGVESQTYAAMYQRLAGLPVEVGGVRVGTASFRFPVDTLPPAERELRDALTRTTLFGIAAAVAVAVDKRAPLLHCLRPVGRQVTAVFVAVRITDHHHLLGGAAREVNAIHV